MTTILRRRGDVAQQKINIVAILGLIITVFTSALIYSNSMGRQTEALFQLGDRFREMGDAFNQYKKEMKSETKDINDKLSSINAEVRTNSELNKKQVDAYQAEVIATKVVNTAIQKISQDVKVYR